MRRKFFGWMAMTLCAAAAAMAGCGGKGGDASNYVVPPIPGLDIGERFVSYQVNNYKASDDCKLVVSPIGSSETDTKVKKIKISTNADYTAAKEEAAEENVGEAAAVKDTCGLYQEAVLSPAAAAARAEIESGDKVAAKAEAPSFKGKPAGYVADLWINSDEGFTQQKVIKVLDDSETLHCNILSFVSQDQDGKYIPGVDKEYALYVAKFFDSLNPADPSGKAIGIYEGVTSRCGHEWTAGGGRDGDIRVNIVLMDAASLKTGLLGYVSPYDVLNYRDFNDPDVKVNFSNQGEYIYLNYGAFTSEEYNAVTMAHTLAHEFTHMVYMNQKVCHDGKLSGINLDGDYSEGSKINELAGPIVLNEGLAETSATMCGLGVRYASEGTDEFHCAEESSLDQLHCYLNGTRLNGNPSASKFPEPFFTEDRNIMAYYPIGHLFGLHVSQYYGEDKLKALYTSKKVGIECLEEVLESDISDIIHRYNMSLALCGTTGADEKYKIPYINFSGKNYYCDGKDYEIKDVAFSPLSVTSSIYPKTGYQTKSVKPWLDCFYGLVSTSSSPLGVGAVVPSNAKINLIHTDSSGNIIEIY